MKIENARALSYVTFDFKNGLEVSITPSKNGSEIAIYDKGKEDTHTNYYTAEICATAGIEKVELNLATGLDDAEIAQVLAIVKHACWYKKYHFQRR